MPKHGFIFIERRGGEDEEEEIHCQYSIALSFLPSIFEKFSYVFWQEDDARGEMCFVMLV